MRLVRSASATSRAPVRQRPPGRRRRHGRQPLHDRADTAGRDLAGISPKAAVSIAFAQTLAASEQFQEIRMPGREPVG